MSAADVGNDYDNRLYGEMTEIKELLKVLIQSQAKQAESQDKLADAQVRQIESQEKLAKSQAQQAKAHAQSQAQQAKSQENIQNQMLEVLKSISSAGNKQQEKDVVKNNNGDSKDITKASGSGGAGEVKQPPIVEEKVFRAIYKPDRDDLLLKGDSEKTIKFLKKNPEALKHGITSNSNNVLHAAIYRKRGMMLIEEIMKLMSPELLEYRGGDNDFTPLHYAAQMGNFEASVLLVKNNPKLPHLPDKRGFTPLDIALRNVSKDQKEVVDYLYSVTKDADPSSFSGGAGAYTLCRLIECNFYDLALCVVMKYPKLAMTKSSTFDMCGLEMMVRRPFAFQSGAKLTWWQNLIYSVIQVDMNYTCREPMEPAECTIRDEENPMPENLDDTKVVDQAMVSSSTTYKRIIMRYLTRALGIERLYNQKLVHQQSFFCVSSPLQPGKFFPTATALIKQMLVEICKSTTLLSFLKNNPNVMKVAIKHGIIEFVAECLEKKENLIFDTISGEKLIEIAIIERKEMIVNLIYETSDKLEMKIDLVCRKDLDKNTILHYAAKLAPFAQLNLVSGAALQMQRELQWFKGTESVLRESDRFARNKEGDTAQFKFTEVHKDLVKDGQDWLKDTSGSCMIVGALIATVAFAAAFTVPGGNYSDSNDAMKGTPIFLGKSSFTVFAVSDALALFSSITSVLMFLAIYTSRYAEIDFLKSLPQKLIFGLATLFISMVAIMVAFGASLFIVVGSKFAQALIPIALLSCCPLGLFAWLQLPLFIEMVRSTYCGSLFKKHRYTEPSSMKNENISGKKKKGN
ncbi:hypothetical protein MKX03_031449 [Papaver bracteatum]|nr:hypothetical protein MKX03_031449 [Papaver bracteatum]